MPIVQIYSKGDAPVQIVRGLSAREADGLVRSLTDDQNISTSIRMSGEDGPVTIHFMQRHVTQIEVYP